MSGSDSSEANLRRYRVFSLTFAVHLYHCPGRSHQLARWSKEDEKLMTHSETEIPSSPAPVS